MAERHMEESDVAHPGEAETPPEPSMVEIEALLKKIDLSSMESILRFGMEAQEPLMRLTEEILADARARDAGEVGEILNDAVARMRGLDFSLMEKRAGGGTIGRLLGRQPPIVRFVQSFESVDSHMDAVKDRLLDRHAVMLAEVKQADVKYRALLDYHHELGKHAGAAETLMQRVDDEILPAAQRKAEGSDPAVAAQRIGDLRTVRETLSNKLHDLRLTRQAVMQAIPAVRAKQAADKALAEKLYSMIVNGVPLWKLNVANALGVQRTHEASAAAKTVSDFANEQLKATARGARAANKQALEQASRGVYDMDAIRVAHEETIGLIEDTLSIRASAERRREDEVKALRRQELELRESLRRAQ